MDRSLSQSNNTSPFDAIRQMDNGREFWSARDLHDLLGYSTWQKFQSAINRAMKSYRNSDGIDVEYHFNRSGKMVSIGSGAEREMLDYHMSRHTCYLVAMNGDPDIPSVALAQKYFAAMTREAETRQQPTQDLFELFGDSKLLRSTIESLEDKSLSLRKMLQFLKFGEQLRYPCQAGRTRGRRRTPRIELSKAARGIEVKQLLLSFVEE